jgi:hypothetical protein
MSGASGLMSGSCVGSVTEGGCVSSGLISLSARAGPAESNAMRSAIAHAVPDAFCARVVRVAFLICLACPFPANQSPGTAVASMALVSWREFTADDPLAHPVDKRDRCIFAAGPEQLRKRRRKRHFRDQFRLDSGGQSFGPGFRLAFERCEALFLAHESVEFDQSMSHFDPPVVTGRFTSLQPSLMSH